MKPVRAIWLMMPLFFGGCSGDDDAVMDASGVDAGGVDAPMDSSLGDGGSDAAERDTSNTDSGVDASNVDAPAVSREECLARAAAVEFRASPPDGETKLQGLGQCADALTGPELYDYYCVWCHSTLDNNDIQERTLEKTIWAVDLGEDVRNWPAGELSEREAAVELLYQTLLEAPPAVVDAHPHPLPEFR